MRIFELFQDDRNYFKHLNWQKKIAVNFFVLQIILIIWARFAPERYFCWAPHDCQTEYELTVFVNGRELTPEEIKQRYHHPKKYRDVRSSGNVKGWIMQHARTYGRNEESVVIMNYQVNGIQQEPWTWHHVPNNQ